MAKPKVFISHIHDEHELAKLIRNDLLDAHLLSALDIFVSSDSSANPGGTSWLNNIEDNLCEAVVLLILASPASVQRPWINVEAGAGWVRYLQARRAGTDPVTVMPLCHSGLSPGRLSIPWSTFNAVEVRTEGGLQAVLDTCARAAGIRSPKPNLNSLALQVQQLEARYTLYRNIEARVQSVTQALGATPDFFRLSPPPGQLWLFKRVPQRILLSIEADLLWLRSEGHITYSQGGLHQIAGGTGAGTFIDLQFAPTQTFLTNTLPNLNI